MKRFWLALVVVFLSVVTVGTATNANFDFTQTGDFSRFNSALVEPVEDGVIAYEGDTLYKFDIYGNVVKSHKSPDGSKFIPLVHTLTDQYYSIATENGAVLHVKLKGFTVDKVVNTGIKGLKHIYVPEKGPIFVNTYRYVYAVDSLGQTLWQSDDFAYIPLAFATEKFVFLANKDGKTNTIHILDATTGELVQKYGGTRILYNDEKNKTMYFSGVAIISYNYDQGFENWRTNNANPDLAESMVILDDGTLLVGTFGKIYALNPKTREALWVKDFGSVYSKGLYLVGDEIYYKQKVHVQNSYMKWLKLSLSGQKIEEFSFGGDLRFREDGSAYAFNGRTYMSTAEKIDNTNLERLRVINDANKSWTVHLSKEARQATVTTNAIYIVASDGVKHPVTLTHYGKQVIVKPTTSYVAGKRYTLVVNNQLLSKGGKVLAPTVALPFELK